MLVYLQVIASEKERSAFELIYLEYRQLMFAVAKKILHNDQDAEDAVHQAFLALLQSPKKSSTVRCPETKALCIIIAEHKAIDILRAKKHISQEELNETVCGVEVPLPGDSSLADALAKLPARYREILLLRFHMGYSTRELARLFGITHGSVQKLLWRAKAALQEQLKKEEVQL